MKRETESEWNAKPNYLKLKKGDLCVMHTCNEAELKKYHGRVWGG